MSKFSRLIVLTILILGLTAGVASALTFGDLNAGNNITINDRIWNSYWSGGSPALNRGGEDNETERLNNGTPTYTGQKWDFEGMYWNRATQKLTIVAGWNFQTGVPYGDSAIQVGDLFLGTWGATSLRSDGGINQGFNASKVLTFQRDDRKDTLLSSGGFNLIEGPFSVVNTADVTPVSDPYRWSSGGTFLRQGIYTTGIIDDNTGMPFLGWNDSDVSGNPFNDTHYFMQISGLTDSDIGNLILHITLECGNDVGRAQLPEPGSLLLLGLGLLGIAGIRRKMKK